MEQQMDWAKLVVDPYPGLMLKIRWWLDWIQDAPWFCCYVCA